MWLLSAVATAQEVACVPVPVAEAVAAVDAVEGALANADLDGAAGLADVARDRLRCIDVPVPAGPLGRYAWARAELEADVDVDLAWPWIHLAQEVGWGEPPERLDPDHPLRLALADPPDPPPSGGPTGVVLARPKKGEIHADGKPLADPVLTLGTPHLVQVFDRDVLHLSVWQTGAAFPPSLLIVEVGEGNRARPTVGAGDELPPAKWKPAKLNTVEAYKDWLKKHPDGPWDQAARDGLDDLAWAEAVRQGTELAAKQYLHDFPEGLHVDEAAFRIDDLMYRAVMADPKRSGWEALLAASPEGAYASEAALQIDVHDWTEAQRRDDAAGYRGYREKHPTGRNAERAAALEEERTLDEARATRTDSALQRFLERFPDGRFADEARAILGEATFDAVTVEVTSTDPAVADGMRPAVLAELALRKIPVVDAPGPRTASVVLAVGAAPRGSTQTVWADLAIWADGLERPVTTLEIRSTLVAGADPVAPLTGMLLANLRSLARWFPAEVAPPTRPFEIAEALTVAAGSTDAAPAVEERFPANVWASAMSRAAAARTRFEARRSPTRTSPPAYGLRTRLLEGIRAGDEPGIAEIGRAMREAGDHVGLGPVYAALVRLRIAERGPTDPLVLATGQAHVQLHAAGWQVFPPDAVSFALDIMAARASALPDPLGG